MKRQPVLTLLVAVLLALTCLYAGPIPAAHAATIVVDTPDDELNSDGDCSLREAIQAANTDTAVSGCSAGSGADTITLPAGFYTLTIAGTDEEDNGTGDLDVTDSLTINGDGEGTTVIQGGTNSTNGIDRVLDIHGTGVTVEINEVRIRYGRASGRIGDDQGGGIRNYGKLTLNKTTVSSNAAPSSGANGGGIYNWQSATLTLNDSTVGYNTAEWEGGGIYNNGTLTLNRTTVNGNTSGFRGGGIHNHATLTVENSTISGNASERFGGGICNDDELSLSHATIANNTADSNSDGWGDGGGISVDGGTVNVMNTIIGGNEDKSGEAHDCSGTLTSQGYNLLEQTDGCTLTSATGDVTGLDPELRLLAQNGGSTRTHALEADSPAIEQIPRGTNGCEFGVSTDQRGYPRARGAGYGGSLCDIGAYEYDTAPPIVRFWLETYSVDENDGTATITVVLNAASGNTVTVDYASSDGTAIAGSDYSPASGMLTFNPGVTSRTFTVHITDDTVDEADETVTLALSNASNATLGGTNPATLTIEDDDPLPAVSFGAATYSVNEGAGSASIAVDLNAPSGRLVEVDCTTSDGTATAGSDYTASSATVYFYPGDTSKSFAVPITEDAVDEANETVRLTLSDASNATIGGTNPATLTIVDNDGADVFIYLPLVMRHS